MKRIVAIIICMHCCLIVAYTQGFDWQTSPRAPYQIPKRYIGLEVGSGYTQHYGSLEYIEQEVGIVCCDYESGNGLPLSISVTGEQWITPTTSVVVGLGVTRFNALFKAPSTPVVLPNGDLLQTEYVLEGALTYITVSGGAQTRLFGTHLTVGGGLRVLLYAGGNLHQEERVITPEDFLFTENPRSRVKVLGNSFLDDATGLQIEPYVQVGYNLSIANGFYLSPSISIGIPLFTATGGDSWRMIDFGARIRLMKGL
ncbi:MAG: hypothetical protein H7X70_03540 [Candidatus Kapabacteria bacterium]|nr:hypothetical protein [Candidatus Kapabacteria bacterium]